MLSVVFTIEYLINAGTMFLNWISDAIEYIINAERILLN